MARLSLFLLIAGTTSFASAITCPGFPGYCSESFPGQTCVVVCAKGRNNVPLCQEDGTWTDIPRCVEHEPGVEIQIPGLCPGIAGYCSEGYKDERCTFTCDVGPNIDSVCTQDGTWEPYPTCAGDLREVQDGCNPCPGPLGADRNRTAEAILGTGPSKTRKPKDQRGQDRIVRPTFAGNQVFGTLDTRQKAAAAQPAPRAPAPAATTPRSVMLKSAFTTAARPSMRMPAPTQRTQPRQQQQQQQQFRPQFQQPEFQNQVQPTTNQFQPMRRPQVQQPMRRPQQQFVRQPQMQPQQRQPMQQQRPQQQNSNSLFNGFGRLPSSFQTLPTSVQGQQQQQPQPQARPANPRARQPQLQITGSIESVQPRRQQQQQTQFNSFPQQQQQQAPAAPRRQPQQQPRRIGATARTPVPPPPQPVSPTRPSPPAAAAPSASPRPSSNPALRIFEEDDLSVPSIGGNGPDHFGAFQAVSLGGDPLPPPSAAPTLPSFPAIPPVSDRSRGLPPAGDQFGPFQHVPL